MTISRTSSTLCSSKCAKHAAVIQSQLLMLRMHVEAQCASLTLWRKSHLGRPTAVPVWSTCRPLRHSLPPPMRSRSASIGFTVK
jgi:hypothetical protein